MRRLRPDTDESFEQRRKARRRRARRECCASRRTLFHLARSRLGAGVYVSHGWASVRTSSTLGRYSSAIRAACANERPSGSVRGAISDGRPYRDSSTSNPLTLALRALGGAYRRSATQQSDQGII